jgi:hypothetical protein
VRLLEQSQHFLARGVEQLGDLVNPDCGQTLFLEFRFRGTEVPRYTATSLLRPRRPP